MSTTTKNYKGQDISPEFLFFCRYRNKKLIADYLDGYGWDNVIAQTYANKPIISAEQVWNEIHKARRIGHKLSLLNKSKYEK